MTTKNIIKIACIYTATLLGAGFATGKELVSFFAKYGSFSIFSFSISCFILALLGISILHIVHKTNVNTYSKFMEFIFGKRLGFCMEMINYMFLFVLFSAMLAGGGATINSLFGIEEIISISIFSSLVFFALIFGKTAIIRLNTILCPLLMLGCILIGIYLSFFSSQDVFNNTHKPIISSFVYASYNTITAISIIFSLKGLVVNRRVVFFGGVLGALFVFLIGIFLLIPLIYNYNSIKISSLPLLELLSQDYVIKIIYSITVLLAIFTTAIGNGFAFIDATKDKFNLSPTVIKLATVFFGICFSYLGFSSMVESVYPLFGYIGLFECLVIFITFCIDK